MKFLWPRFSPRPATAIDGVFLVDSIVFSGGVYGRCNYMEDALQYVLSATGLYCIANVVPGAWYGILSTKASSILAQYGSNFFVVVLACGNDVYSLARPRVSRGFEYTGLVGALAITVVASSIVDRFTALFQTLRRRTGGGILLVFGGVSEIWNDVDVASVYSEYVKLVVDVFREKNMDQVSVIRGEALRGIGTTALRGIDITDSLGHVSDTSLCSAVGAYALFAWHAHTSKL